MSLVGLGGSLRRANVMQSASSPNTMMNPPPPNPYAAAPGQSGNMGAPAGKTGGVAQPPRNVGISVRGGGLGGSAPRFGGGLMAGPAQNPSLSQFQHQAPRMPGPSQGNVQLNNDPAKMDAAYGAMAAQNGNGGVNPGSSQYGGMSGGPAWGGPPPGTQAPSLDQIQADMKRQNVGAQLNANPQNSALAGYMMG